MAKKTQELPNDDNKTFIAEVDDALREERLKTLWDQYKGLIIGAVIALFVLVAGKEFYQNYSYNEDQAAANAYAEASKNKNMEALADIAQSSSSFAPIAAIDLADAALANEDIATATAHYQTIIDHEGLPTEIRDLARYYAALVQLEANAEAAAEHLTKLTGGNSPYRLSALELQARLYSARGERAAAKAFYEEIAATQDAPQSLRDRAQQALNGLK